MLPCEAKATELMLRGFHHLLTSIANRATITLQIVDEMLPSEAKKNHGVAAPWFFRYILLLSLI